MTTFRWGYRSIFMRRPECRDSRHWRQLDFHAKPETRTRDLISCNFATEAIMELVLGVCSVNPNRTIIADMYPLAFLIK